MRGAKRPSPLGSIMFIKMKVSMAGGDIAYQPGQVIEVEARIGKAWIEAGIAVGVKDEPESTAMEQPENASLKPARKRK